MIEKLAKQIKRNNKKRNLNITLATIVGFLLSSAITYGVEENLTTPITSDTSYTEDTTLNMKGEQIIKKDNSGELNISGKKLILNHSTSDYISKGTVGGILGSILTMNDGNINIEADKLSLNSTFNGTEKDLAVGVLSQKGTTMNLSVGNINIDTNGNSTIYGIVVESAKMNIESEEIAISSYSNEADSIGLGTYRVGNTNIKTNDLLIKSEAKEIANGIENSGTLEINSNNLTKIEAISEKDAVAIGNSGDLKINSNNTFISSSGKESGYGIENGGTLEINNKDLVKIEATSENEAVAIHNSGDLKINSNNTFISSSQNGIENGGTLEINNKGLLKIEITSEKGNTVIKNNGDLKINSENTFISSSGKNSTGISSIRGTLEINGGLEIETNTPSGLGTAIYATFENTLIDINKKNENVSVKIKGDLVANGLGIININFNGKESYFIGKSYIENRNLQEINLGISNGAVWKNEAGSETSKVNSLKFNNGNIDMTHQANGQKIEIDKISGNNGKIIMDISSTDIDQTGGKTDFISIKEADAEQKHYIEIGKDSIADLVNYDFANNILIGEASDKVKFEGSALADISNVYDYTLKLKEEGAALGNNWYVTGVEKKESSTTETVVDDMSLHYMNAGLARMEADALHKRLGDIRDSKEGAGVWSRVVSGQMESDKNGYFKNDYTMIQAGIDKSETSMSGTWITGIAVQRREGKTDFRNGDGKNESTGISLYKSWFGNENQYLDLVGKYSHIKNEYKSYNTKNEKTEADYHTNAGTLSIEYGKRISKNKWYLQPHVQTTYTWIEGKNYMTSSDVRAEQKDINSLIGKAGIYAGYDFGRSSHFIKAGVLHEFMGDYGVTIKGKDTSITKDMNGRDTWIELGIGGDIKIGKTDSTNVYYEIERTFGGDFETNWQASLGIRYKF